MRSLNSTIMTSHSYFMTDVVIKDLSTDWTSIITIHAFIKATSRETNGLDLEAKLIGLQRSEVTLIVAFVSRPHNLKAALARAMVAIQ